MRIGINYNQPNHSTSRTINSLNQTTNPALDLLLQCPAAANKEAVDLQAFERLFCPLQRFRIVPLVMLIKFG